MPTNSTQSTILTRLDLYVGREKKLLKERDARNKKIRKRIERLDKEILELSVIGAGGARGICGSGLISLTDALFRAGWIDRGGKYTPQLPARYSQEDRWGRALALSPETGDTRLWHCDP